MKVISIVAQKGGTGKTTTAMTIAGYLSGKGKKTLVIDFNEQGDLSDTLGAEAQTSGAGEVLKGAYIENVAQKTNLKKKHSYLDKLMLNFRKIIQHSK